jgi:UDP-glucose 4-epimerase
MYGPGQDPEQGLSLAAQLVHAALRGRPPNLENVFAGFADDALDLCYIKDMGRAIALLQTAEKLPHDVYNISAGKLTPNRELVEAIKEAVPGFQVDLPPGHWPGPSLPVLDTERLRVDTGYIPAYDVRSAIRNYVDWLKAGNAK